MIFSLKSIEFNLTINHILQKLLEDQTYCLEGRIPTLVRSYCETTYDSASTGVLVGVILSVFIVIAILSVMVYKSYAHSSAKREMLKKWTIAYPKTTEYRYEIS